MTRDLRHVALGIVLLLIAVILGHLIPGFGVSLLEAGFRDAMHVLGFAVVAAVLFEMIPGSTTLKVMSTSIIGVSIGIVAEAVQSIYGTGFDPRDLMRDALGVGVFLAARLCWYQSAKNHRFRVLLRSVAALSIIGLFLPFVSTSAQLIYYAARMPLIFDAERSIDRRLLWPINSELRFAGESGHEVLLGKTGWTGVLIDSVVSDWTDYRQLHISVSLDSEPADPVEVYLSDGYHPGFKSEHRLGQQRTGAGDSEVVIDIVSHPEQGGRPPLDLSGIEQIYIIAPNDQAGATLSIDKVWLQ